MSRTINPWILAIVILGIVAIGDLVHAGNEENENKQKVAITELPAAVQKTIQDNLGGTVKETAKETKEGKTYYEAEVQKVWRRKGRDQGR